MTLLLVLLGWSLLSVLAACFWCAVCAGARAAAAQQRPRPAAGCTGELVVPAPRAASEHVGNLVAQT